MTNKFIACLQLIPIAFILPINAFGSAQDDCLLKALKTSPSETTIGELRKQCEPDSSTTPQSKEERPGVIERRFMSESKIDDDKWAITPHKPTYILPFTYNKSLNTEPFEETGEAQNLENTEVKFQISFKFPVSTPLFDDRARFYFAYTNLSWWQLYSTDISSPFRETNHEPELFFRLKNDWQFLGLKNSFIDFGLVHQSNGRAGSLSRSWNRAYIGLGFERGNFAFGIRPWIRISEDAENDDNPDITDFLGNGDFRAVYVRKKHTFSTLLRNNLKSDNKGAAELTWSFPFAGKLRAYAQYFYGYGESLLDYNAKTNRFGLGISINDYLQ